MPSEPQPQPEPQPEESVPKESKIPKVDLRAKINNVRHHTDEVCKDKLIVRRGQSFCICLKLKEPFNPEVHNLKFTATTGDFAEEKGGTKSLFGIPDFVKRSAEAKAVWKAELGKKESTEKDEKESDKEEEEAEGKEEEEAEEKEDVFITITPPADAPVGLYFLSVNFLGEDKDLGSLALLFNPWCPEDSVYMEKKKARQEYVMNEHGIVYRGSANWIMPLDWDYGQFEEDMVEIVMGLLHLNRNHLEDPVKDEAAWSDPVYVGRVISAMINSEGDHGVLEGRWGGGYAGGVCPSHWSGSHAILHTWLKSGCHPVKYGQCWVFAGVMCSVMRTLGIPCRTVTNFASAHDTDMNLIIDEYHAGEGVEEMYSDDSVWNFHVWVEGWMKRPDLSAEGKYDGWQVLDPTPQELSGGAYQCGPASVKAIFEGQTDLPFDIPFVFAEVNADCVDWLMKADGTKKKLWSDTKRVGQSISTKCMHMDKRKDLTYTYKHKEGSEKERAVFKYASVIRDYSNNDGDMDSEESDVEEEEPVPELEPAPEPELPKVSLRFEEVSELVSGKDVKLNLVLHSEATEPRPLSIDITVKAKTYTGTEHTKIQQEQKKETLQPGQDLCIPVVVPFSKYWEAMLEKDVINISAIVSDVNDDDEVYLAENDVVLLDPPIVVEPLNEPQVFRQMYLDVSFVNPVHETLKGCTLTLSGSGLWKVDQEISLPDLGPRRRVRVRLLFYPYKCGKKTLVVDFNCSVFRDIKKSITLDVKRSYGLFGTAANN